MHEYYAHNRDKIKNYVNGLVSHIAPELEAAASKPYVQLFDEIWDYYDTQLLERFPYIGGDKVSGTRNLTGGYAFIAMGEVMRGYGMTLEEVGHLMALAYERETLKMPAPLRWVMGKAYQSPRLLTWMMRKKDVANAANAAENPGSFETETQEVPEEGYDFSYHNLVCPQADFARRFGYEEYMPYLCNLDYVMFGVLGAPLYREHTCFADGDYCDFKLKLGAEVLPWWPPVFEQDNPYK